MSRDLPCAMEVSTTGISGGPQPSPLPPPSLTAVNDAHDEGQNDLVHNKIVSDCPMEDRGVDLSFDTTAVPVKKELENVSDNNNPSSNSSDLLPSPRIHPAALKVKEEYKEFSDIKPQCQSPSLLTSSPGGRLKIFQSKFFSLLFHCTMDDYMGFLYFELLVNIFESFW